MLQADKEPHGIEPNSGFWQDPLLVNRRLLKKPERSEALGLVF